MGCRGFVFGRAAPENETLHSLEFLPFPCGSFPRGKGSGDGGHKPDRMLLKGLVLVQQRCLTKPSATSTSATASKATTPNWATNTPTRTSSAFAPPSTP